MAIDYQETDTDPGAAASVWCASGETAAWGTAHDRTAEVGGTPGTGSVPHNSISAGLTRVVMPRLIVPAAGVTWDAGTWTINHNVVVANSALTITGCYICRLNSSYVSQATIGSRTDLSIGLGTTGVKQFTVTGSAQTPSTDDKVAILIRVASSVMNSSHNYTPNQLVSSPFTAPAVEPEEVHVRTMGVGLGVMAHA